jgi:GntR family transcriptional regulator
VALKRDSLVEYLVQECTRRRPGEVLPTVRQLIAEGRGSRTMVGDALNELVRRGLVRSKHGAGYTVLPQRTATLQLLRQHGAAGSTEPDGEALTKLRIPGRLVLVQHTEVEPLASIAHKLALAPDDLMVVCRTHHALEQEEGPTDNGAFLLQQAWYPRSVARAAGLDDEERAPDDALAALAAAGLVGRAREQVRFRPATDPEAETLGLPYAESVVQIERVLHDGAGSPVELLHLVAPAAITELVYEGLPFPGMG